MKHHKVFICLQPAFKTYPKVLLSLSDSKSYFFQLSFSSNHWKGIFQTHLFCHVTGCTPTVFSWLLLKKLTPQELVGTQAGWLPRLEKLLWLVRGKVSKALKLIHQKLFSIRNLCVFSLVSFSNMHSWQRADFFFKLCLWANLGVLACTRFSCKSSGNNNRNVTCTHHQRKTCQQCWTHWTIIHHRLILTEVCRILSYFPLFVLSLAWLDLRESLDLAR